MYSRDINDSYQGSLTLTHTVSSSFFYNAVVSFLDQGYNSGIGKDTSLYIPETDFDAIITPENGREHRDFWAKANPTYITDSRTKTLDARLDAVLQLDRWNEIKLGLQYKTQNLHLFSVYGIKRPLNLQYIDNYNTDRPYEFSAYVQDKIEFPYIVVNLGLRYDYMNANVLFRSRPLDPNSIVEVKSRSQLSPRIGIAHPISDRTKLHFAYGHFFQNPEYQFLFTNQEYKISVREPLFGQPGLDAQRTIAYEVGLSHQFTDDIVLRATAYYKDVSGLIGTRYFPYYQQAGQYSAYTLYINEDYANMKGFEVTLDMRPTDRFTGGLTYTYSVAKGNASSEDENYPAPYKATQLYYLDFDKTHILNANAQYRIPPNEGPRLFGVPILEHMDFSLLVRASSGYPYTASGRDVGFVAKNALRRPATYSIDCEFSKQFEVVVPISVRLFVEVQNLTDRRNVLYVYGDTGDPDFTFVGGTSTEYQRDPSNYGPPRTIRVGASVQF
jgi:outer membrane receptor for Fe3+-dicitrate